MSNLNGSCRQGLAAALMLLGAPRASGQSAAADSLAAAERNTVAISAQSGFAAAIRGALAKNGTMLWAGAPVVSGADQVGRLLAAQRLLDSLRITWQPLGQEMATDATLGVTWGVAVAARDGTAGRIGRYIAVWRPEGAVWKLAAFVSLALTSAAATILPADLGPLQRAPSVAEGAAAKFIAADIAFARFAGDSGAARAFERFAAPEAVTFGAGTLTRGPTAIRQSLEGGPASHWAWHPVGAGASVDGTLGFTVGESEIKVEGSPTSYGKYLTIWRHLAGGAVKFLTDGGNARPSTP